MSIIVKPSGNRSSQKGPERVLITGASGSGKTFIATTLNNQGINAFDADSIKGLCGWFDTAGNRVNYPPDAGEEFLGNHAFLWSRDFLARFLDRQNKIYLFGVSRNAFEMIDLFDNVFFLKISPDILVTRLRNGSRVNPMGRTAYQIKYVLQWARKYEEIARALCIRMIDANKSPRQIFSQIAGGCCE